MELKDVLEKARSEMAAVTGLKPVSVTHAFKNDHSWRVRVELLEMSRLSPATDLVGDYEALLSDDGALLMFARKRTRLRGESREEPTG